MKLSGICPSMCLSVCLSVRFIFSRHAAAAGLLLWARQAGDIDRLLHSRLSSKCEQCHAVGCTLEAEQRFVLLQCSWGAAQFP